MKIDRGKIKKSTSEVPPDCQALIEKLRSCSRRELLEELKKIDTWTFGKCELYHWIDILDLCDSILESATTRVSPKSWQIACDLPENYESKELLLWVLHFTTLLIEHSFSRHLYNSVEHLLTLLSSCDLNVVLGVLNLLYMFSKRSNFITRINPEMRTTLLKCLTYLAESWGGRENGFGLADCVREDTDFPPTATTLHYEFYTEDQGATSQASCIHLDNVDQINKLPSEIMDGLIETFNVPKDGHMLLFTHLRLAHSFSNHSLRLKCVQARLQALSVLLYSNADSHNLLYPGILDELVQLLELNNPGLVEIRSAALRTLTSIIHLDRSPHLPKKPGSRLNMIIDVTGAGLYHGFLPQLVRSCISSLTSENKEGEEEQFPLPLATALFSFLYHLASYEAGGEALVSCGMMECLLRVINWPGVELEHITFVTRAVRVIDLITNIDMQSFQSHGGLNSFINRLQMEMAICRQEQPFEIQVPSKRPRSDSSVEAGSPAPANPSDAAELDEEMVRIANYVDRVAVDSDSCSCSKDQMPEPTLDKTQIPDDNAWKCTKTCLPQRAALLKSMLNFLKKALQDPAFTESIRHVMDGSLPSSLKHIISNAEYYGPSLFLLATDVVAVYVFQEPSLLSSLQDVGITEVVLHALLIKNVPATREVLGSVPNVFSALCLNQRGLQSFIRYKPFEKLFKVLLSPNYLSAMRRRRSSDPIGDTASNLGNAMDELMRHQPTLKSDAIAAIIKLLQELCQLGRDPKYVCWKPQKGSSNESPHPAPRVSNEAGSSDEEEEDEEEASTSSHPQPAPETTPTTAFSEKTPIALVDYILNVMKFVDAILSNNSTDDHCREFVNQNGLVPLLSILGLPNLPVDYPITPAPQAVASVCKSVLNLAHEPQVIRQGLTQLREVLSRLGPLCTPHQQHTGSILLEELAKAPCIDTAFSDPSATPLLHAMAATHGYIIMFVHVCRTGQLDIRTISLTNWGSELGLSVLSQLADLYTALVWESTVLLALCSDDSSQEFNKEDVYKIYPPSMMKMQAESMEVSTEGQEESMEVDDDKYYKTATSSKPTPLIPQNIKLKYIKPLLGASSRLGRALAELFGLLVKLCVGFPVRTRRGNHLANTPVSPSPWSIAVSNSLATLLARGLNHNFLPNSSVPKFKLTYLICSVGFTQPMLFDEKRYPYHLMLLKFVHYKGQAAFFETFKWALSGGGKFPPELGLNHEELPEGTGEFLDAWLLLLEKMVNPKAILETSHLLTPRLPPLNIRFDPIKYLQQVHKLAFEALSYLWGRKPLPTYGARMTETILTIYRHIIRGEKIVEEYDVREEAIFDYVWPSQNRLLRKRKLPRERKQKETNETTVLANPAASESRRSAGARERPEVNSTELSQLMDMGFSREHCYEALILTSSLEHATDYLLNNFFPHNVQPTQSLETEEPEEPNEPLSKEALDEFSNQVLRVCLDYVEKLPETVYRVCDLLTIIIRRNGETFCYKLLNTLAEETIQNVHLLLDQLCNLAAQRRLDMCDSSSSNISVHETVLNSPYSVRIAGNLHLFMLLFEEIKVPCAKVVHGSNLLNVLVRLLVEVTDVMEEGAATPKWMAPLLLLIDLLEKVSVCVTRKVNMHKVTTQVWRWLDLASGRWSLYLPHNNKLINEAYWRGDRDVTITSGRRRYTIAFPSMCQINDDSGKARPVMMTLIDPKDPTAKSNYDNQPTDLPPYPATVTNPEDKDPNDTVESLSEPEYYVDFFHRRVGLQPITGVNPQDIQTILRCCMQLISKPVDPDTLHAVMQVCVRFTRDYENARLIAEMGAVKRLLKLRQVSSFNGFLGLSTMLIRHILEEPANITAAIERVIRFKTLPNIPPTFKELHYILRECAPAICRDPEIFKNVAKEIMRVDISVLNKRSEEDDPRLLMKCLPSDNQKNNKEVDRLVKKTITQLLNFLVEARQEEMGINDVILDDDQSSDGTLPPSGGQPAETLHFEENVSSCSTVRNDRDDIDLDTFNASSLPMYIAASGPISGSAINKKSTSNAQQKDQKPDTLFERKKKLPLLLISYILKILGDAVRSYTCIAKMITDHKYSAKQSEILKEDCSAVAFVLDHLMPYRELNIQVDPERPNMARNLIAALASCNHSPEAQCALVSEVKAALQRTLAWPESAKKHTHIQDLVGVVTTMIDNCPPVPISSTPLSPALKLNQYSVNNMVRFMMRKGIVTDLARIPHNLDLSSPKMAATINAALKPLETLSRIMGQPSAGPTPSKAKPKGSATTTTTDDTGSTLAASVQSETNQLTQMDQSGTAPGGEEDNTDMIDDNPVLSEVMNSVVERVNEMEDLMQNVIERRRIPNLNNPRHNRRSRGQRRVISELSRFTQMFTSNNDLNHFSTNEETSQDSSSEDSDSNPTDEERHMEDAATDIDDHVEDDDDDDDEEEEDEDDDDDDDDDDDEQEGNVTGEENEGEESNGGYDEDGLELFEPDEGLFRIPGLDRDSDDFLMIEYSEPDPSAPLSQPWSRDNFLPFTLFEDGNNASDNSGSRSSIPTQHPLLMARNADSQPTATSGNRTQRMSRTRRYQYIQMNRAAVAAPVFLQRLMGQSNSDPPNYLNIPGHPGNTYGEMLASTFPNTRLIVMDNGLGILTNSEEEQINFVDQSGYLLGPSLAATLNNVPTSMYWWNEELRLLDRDSICDCSICVGFELVPIFEQYRNEEFAERKKNRKKMDDEEDNNKKANSMNGETEKKKLYDGIMDMFDSPRPPARMPTRRIAMLAAAQEVAHATESLAGSIVESVLHPRVAQPPGARPLHPIQPPSPQETADPPPSHPPPSQEQSDVIVVPFIPSRRTQASSIPEALELIPVAPPVSEISDPMGLIPGSVPYPPPSDPEDGFFRVNPPTLIGQNRNENSTAEIRSNESTDEVGSSSSDLFLSREARSARNFQTAEQRASISSSDPFTSREAGNDGNAQVLERRSSTSSSDLFLSREARNAGNFQTAEQGSSTSSSDPFTSREAGNDGNAQITERRSSTSSSDLFTSREARNAGNAQVVERRSSTSSSDLFLSREARNAGNAQVVERRSSTSSSDLFTSRETRMDGDFQTTEQRSSTSSSDLFSSRKSRNEGNIQTAEQRSSTSSSDPFTSREARNDGNTQTAEERFSNISSDPFAAEVRSDGSSQTAEHRSSTSSSDIFTSRDARNDGNGQMTEQRVVAVDMSPSSNSSHSLFGDSPAGNAPLSHSSQNSTHSLFVDSPAGTFTHNGTIMMPTSPEHSPPRQAPPIPAPTEPSANQPSMSSQSSLVPEEIPEGVDPSFLAALPEDMRAEVISEHLRLQRLQNRVQQSTSQGSADDAYSTPGSSGMEVNADFLAALPPAIQEEVLAQQRLEQQRQAAALSNPNDPVDAAAFFQDLPHSLRQAILTDMEESQISVLPPELAAEAQNLRREWEARNRQLMQERFLSHVSHSTSALSSILRHTSTPRNLRRPTGPRYTIQNMNPGNRTHWLSSWNLGARLLDSTQSSSQTGNLTSANLASASGIIGRPRGRQVLDYESICCLLVLLFVDDSRLNTARLHRVFRNLCYHPPTREWVIRAILSIMEKSNDGQSVTGDVQGAPTVGSTHRMSRSQSQPSPEPPPPPPAPALVPTASTSSTTSSSSSRSGSSWLNISMDAALGCRATVFHVHKNPGRRNDRTITINPQAAPFVYRHALEILISLARIFPSYFVPGKPPNTGSTSATASPPKASKAPRPDNSPNFWDLLIRLDSLSTSKKGKAVTRQSAPAPADSESLCLESSPFGQLLKMLASPVVHRSPLLMDKLLRLLSLISISLQVHRQRLWDRLGLQVEVNPTTLHHLGLAIDVLTSNTCSEEGLEDATALLLNMTVNLPNTRETVLSLLLGGARQMASMVCVHIEQLLQELRVLNSQQAQNEDLEDNVVDSRITSLKGILSNRFTKDTVVVTAPKKVKAGLDLQLNSMAPLISKTSSQAFFLRILKVIVQLRESVRNFDKKKRKQAAEAQQSEQVTLRSNVAQSDTSSTRDTSAAGTADTAMDTTQTQEPPPTTTPPLDMAMDTNQPMTSSSDTVATDTAMETNSLARWLRPTNGNVVGTTSTTGTIDDTHTSERPATAKTVEEDAPLPPLSEQLNLDTLWDTLSECLTELEHTNDNHAVLVLQPAVEAFFLVHASGLEKVDQKTEARPATEQPIVVEETPAGASASAQPPPQPQSLGLEGLTQAPPPVSPLPTEPANDATTSQPSTSNYFPSITTHESSPPVPPHQLKFLKFAETHRTVLNQILRQCTTPLLEGPFAVLVNHTRVLDFDVKRRYFRGELERADEGHRREELAVHVRRTQVFEDSFRELHRRSPEEWKNRFYIVFEGEEGQDAGGLLREWYMIISREIFNPMYALFTTSPGDRVTYMINPSSHCNPNHLCYFKFVGRVIAKAIYDNKLLECYFTRSFYKHILGILVKYTDMESEDYSFYKGLVFLMENHVDMLGYELTFSTEVQEFGVTDVRDLLPNGRNILVTEENKMEYIRLVCQMKMTGAIRKQLNAFLEGFYDIIPKRLISIFNEQELELLISGLPNVDIEDLKANTEYYKYQPNSLQIQWFWRALREFDQAERAKFLQFVTGTSKVPLQGFAALEGMNGVQKFQIHRDERSTDRLPSAHTCFNQLDLPVYETYTKLRTYLLKAIHECSEGFGFA